MLCFDVYASPDLRDLCQDTWDNLGLALEIRLRRDLSSYTFTRNPVAMMGILDATMVFVGFGIPDPLICGLTEVGTTPNIAIGEGDVVQIVQWDETPL